ncbi:helix-turn-helix domain-containing protein [Acidobacteriota bacterium]
MKTIMETEEKTKYLKILGLSSDATFLEIKRVYKRLLRLYSSETSIISSISDDFSKKEKKKVIRELEDAYKKLSAQNEYEQALKRQKTSPSEAEKPPDHSLEKMAFSGRMLKDIRNKLGIQLYDVSLETKIRKEILVNIELEKFEDLPQESYLRGHVWSYAKYLSLDPKKAVDDYMKKYIEWKEKPREL